jgi:hypothetical protein
MFQNYCFETFFFILLFGNNFFRKMSIRGEEFHSIIENVFEDVNGIHVSEQLQINCPRCQERNGLPYPDGKFNLEINTAKRVFRCWCCDEPRFSGSLGYLIKLYGSNIEYEMYKSYADIYGAYDNEENEEEYEEEYVTVKLPMETISFTDMDVENPEHFEAYNYLVNERKISREIILKYRLGFCVSGKYSKRIIIPSFNKNGEINYFVARSYNPKEKKKYDNPKSDKDKIIFNEGYINWDSVVFLVEGVFDMFHIPNCIPMLGKTLSKTLFFELKKHKPKIVVLLDPDAWKNEMEIYSILNLIYDSDDSANVRLINLKEIYDIDEINKNIGREKIIELLYGARKLNNNDCFDRFLKK